MVEHAINMSRRARITIFFVVISILVTGPARAQGVDHEARGVINAVDRATLSSGISSRISSISFLRGEKFSKGDILLSFDCALEKANADSASASYNGARQTHEKNRELLSFSATGKFDVEISKAEMERARADYQASQAIVRECTIKAPYDGSIVSQFVHPFESVEQVQPLLEIVGSQNFEVTFIVSSAWTGWLKPQQPFTFLIDNLSSEVMGRVDRIGAVIDPVSQTVEVIGIVDAPSALVKAGMSGVARFEKPIGG